MAKKSAGILAYRLARHRLEVLLVHPGGPFWRDKDTGVWSIPKGEFTEEEPLVAARREFAEETGLEINGAFIELSPIKQKDGKVVHAFAVEADIDIGGFKSDLFEMEWPPRSGRRQSFPEVDRAAWYGVDEAEAKIIGAQYALVKELQELIQR